MQTITIAGRVGRDAETRNTQGGDSVTSFTVAVDQREGRDKTTNWWRCSIWGKRGESLAPYLLKGASVTVTGGFSLTEYDGKPQLNCRVSEVALQGGRGDGGQCTPDGSRGAPTGQGGNAGSRFDNDLDDEVPFVTSDSVF